MSLKILLQPSKIKSVIVRHCYLIIVVLMSVAIGTLTLSVSKASTPAVSLEPENGIHTSCASNVADGTVSAGSAVIFSSCQSNPAGSINTSANSGAKLPISYALSTLTGTIRYVATNGSDVNLGTINSPFATLSKAIAISNSNDSIVVRGGTYRQGGMTVTKTLKIVAYPGENPVFNGALIASSGWIVAGNLSYISYTPIPVTDGSGISFSTCQNQNTSCIGKFPDQVWAGASQFRQVSSLAGVTGHDFYVDVAANKLYLSTTDLSSGNVEVSSKRTFMNVSANNVSLRGLEVIRFSNTASDYGVISLSGVADNATIDNVLLSDSAFVGVSIAPSGNDLNTGSSITNSTIAYSNWMGVSANATDNLLLDHNNISNMNQWDEFTASPQSGSLKTSRTWHTRVLSNKIMNNNSQGLWFDQSNFDVEVSDNDIENNSGTGLFFEISDFLYATNNYIKATGGARAVKLAGSSNLFLVNNTIIGGADPVGVYVDGRSIAGCSDPAQPLCANSYNSDRDTFHAHLATMTWIPSIDMFVNNIIAYPSATGYCGNLTALCITNSNGSATVTAQTVIHKADSSNNIPQSFMDGNVYVNGTANIIDFLALANFTNTSSYGAAIAGPPVSLNGFESHGLSGTSYVNADGTPTALLSSLHTSASPVGDNIVINKYVPVGTKHYGVLYK